MRLGPHQIEPSDDDDDVLTTVAGVATWAPAGSGSSDIPESIIDAKGDLIVGTAADTADRVAVGTDGFVLTADSGEAEGVKWASVASVTWPPASITYAQTGKTLTVSRNATGGSSWFSQRWIVAHGYFFNPTRYQADMFQSDTYTLYIDGVSYGSAATTVSGATFAIDITLSGPALAPGVHYFSLRGSSGAHRFYYNSGLGILPTSGTYVTNIEWGPWIGPATEATPHGTLTFDCEGS